MRGWIAPAAGLGSVIFFLLFGYRLGAAHERTKRQAIELRLAEKAGSLAQEHILDFREVLETDTRLGEVSEISAIRTEFIYVENDCPAGAAQRVAVDSLQQRRDRINQAASGALPAERAPDAGSATAAKPR